MSTPFENKMTQKCTLCICVSTLFWPLWAHLTDLFCLGGKTGVVLPPCPCCSAGWTCQLKIDCWSCAPSAWSPWVWSLVLTCCSFCTCPWSDSSALSVLKSHFNPACIGDCKQLLSKSEKRFVHTHWVQEGLGLSEALCVSLCEVCFVYWKEWVSIPKI